MASRVDIQYIQFYTEGSAAKKIATPLPKKRVAEKSVARRAKRKVIRIDPVAILSLAVCLALAITLGLGIGKVQQAKQDNARMAAYVESLTQKSETLAQEYAAGYDLHEIEKTALALGMVHNDQASHRGVSIQMETETSVQPQMNFWQNLVVFFHSIFA